MTALVVAAAAVLAGAFVRGYSGFGASMFWAGSLSLIYAPATVVPTVLALEVLASLSLLPSVWREADWRSLRWLLAGSVVAVPGGIALLATVPAEPMRVVVAMAVLAGTLALASGVRLRRAPSGPTAFAAGTVCGVVNGSTGIGGPPAVLLYFAGPVSNEVGRGTLIAYFLAMDGITLAMMAVGGLVDGGVLRQTLLLAPLALGGIAVGQRVFRRTGGRNFRGAVLVLLGALSVALFARLAFT